MVNSGATLRGGDGTVASGALSLGGAVTMASGSIIELALGSSFTHSTLAMMGAGSLSFATIQLFHFIGLRGTTGTYDNIITGVTNPGMGTSWDFSDANWTYMFLYDGANIDLTLTRGPRARHLGGGNSGGGGAGMVATEALRQRRSLSPWSNG